MDYRVLDRQEVEYLTVLPSLEPRLKVVADGGRAQFSLDAFVIPWSWLESRLTPMKK